MIPVTDAVRARRRPYVNVGIIILCSAIFAYELLLPSSDLDAFFRDFGVIPADLWAWWQDPSGLAEPATIVTSMFLHGGWLHLASNMVFLWVFGDNVEDALGHVGYALFYAACGAAAAVAQVATDTSSTVPIIGASGAIAGVLGAYLVLYPRATVGVIVPWLWFFGAFPIPAAVMILFWFALQLLAGIADLGTDAAQSVAYWAHVGGFAAGFASMFALRPFVKVRPLERRRRHNVW
jgi:membrane associated rhomboid family serine protease